MNEIKEIVDFAIEDGTFRTCLTDKFKQRHEWAAPNDREVLSYIPGTIVSVCVKEGDEVRKGELLLIHEAMKMRNRIVMPFDGRIVRINVVEGERIPKNHIMIEIA